MLRPAGSFGMDWRQLPGVHTAAASVASRLSATLIASDLFQLTNAPSSVSLPSSAFTTPPSASPPPTSPPCGTGMLSAGFRGLVVQSEYGLLSGLSAGPGGEHACHAASRRACTTYSACGGSSAAAPAPPMTATLPGRPSPWASMVRSGVASTWRRVTAATPSVAAVYGVMSPYTPTVWNCGSRLPKPTRPTAGPQSSSLQSGVPHALFGRCGGICGTHGTAVLTTPCLLGPPVLSVPSPG